MCGIVGYVGRRDATPILLDGLQRLEYRGYDSAGVAVRNGHGIGVRKLAGKIAGLKAAVDREPLSGRCGLGHTRWATHGAPTLRNAHPHTDCTGAIAVVHNGIIENADALRAQLAAAGHRFATETDTEVIAHLIEESAGETLEARVIEALACVQGTYGLAVIDAGAEYKIVAARQGSPVILGVGQDELFVASDASAVLEHTRSVVYLKDGDTAVLTPDGYRVLDRGAQEQVRPVDAIEWEAQDLGLGGYPHYMLKEISEQPETVRNTLRGRLLYAEGTARLNGLNLSDADAAAIQRVTIVGCGTSWHAGLVGRHYIERLAHVPVEVEYASEFRYRGQPLGRGSLAVAVSQSGETADTLEALRAARAGGAKVIGIVNVVGSSIARETDGGIYLHAGPEIGVASTTAFTCQLTALLLFALRLARQRGMARDDGRLLVEQIARLPDLVEETLQCEAQVRAIAADLAGAEHALYLGRGPQFPVALEGALKLKEISYVHAEGYPAAEMKHGPIALVDQDMPVVFLAPRDAVYAKVLSNMQEVKARGGRILAVTTRDAGDVDGLATWVIPTPPCPPLLAPLLTVLPLQLLAYHVALLRGCDVDRPRNLAKSVTVE